ncbi:T9SS type B sorting domain-containing protein [uncultured Lacinutrix sp.]|uniref:T9SS type B sorting domain-containing protein n=1 Tax=uncultured Lacinutrix sp. TaxID=574032 RepID=UPI00262587C6|nr:T9SS type B sorting domain-containing protein [uncultured Lacinutrix sp.]
MLKKSFILLCFIMVLSAKAQNQTANWFFGEKAGLTFNSGFPVIDSNGEISTSEGCSTISNSQGQLLFYTDGVTVWNKNHLVMVNGNDLTGDDSSTQSAIIIPKPNSTNIYYIFTVDARAGEYGLRYSEVDMNLANGLGRVTSNKNILLEALTTEKITAVENADGESIWVIAHKWESNEFQSYLVDDTGVNTTPVTSAVGSVYSGDINNTIGYLKASPNREKIACVKSYTNNEVQVFDFNAATGAITNPITIDNFTSENLGPYGCEFSPDSKLLYITEIIRDNADYSKIHQYNLTLGTQQNIINSDVIIAQEAGLLGALQQALDGRIYVAKSNATSICVIKKPNEIGLSCEYESETISLGGRISRLGLPPFIQSYFFATNLFENTCFGETTLFSIDTSTIIDNINWNFGDPESGINNNSSNVNATHVYSAPGTYNITITIDTQGETQVVYRTLTIAEQPPILNIETLTTCETEDPNIIFDLTSNIPNTILNNPDYFLSFFETLDDANNNENSISFPINYSPNSNNQSVFLKINNANGNCYSISQMELSVISKPSIEPYEEVSFCDNDDNAQTIIDVGNLTFPLSSYSFLWIDSNETTPQIQVNQEGSYTVRITLNSSITTINPEGCFAERIVQVNSSGVATITNIETSGTTATIFTTGLGNYEYTLDNPNLPYQANNVFVNISPGIHTVYVKDVNYCGTTEAQFSIIDFPDYFTPNGDTINDFWQVYGISKDFQPKSLIYIYNRYGKLITQIKPNSRGWDGTFNGIPLPQSDYWFSVTLEDGREFKSHFTLKR